MPLMDGLTATKQILALPEPPQVAVLTTFHVDEYVLRGAGRRRGRLPAQGHPAAGDRRRRAGGRRRHRDALPEGHRHAHRLLRRPPRRPAPGRGPAPDTELSDREREVLQLLGSGESNAELAKRLFVSEATVKTYVSRLLAKLDLTNRTQAAILAHEAGLLDG